MKLIIAGSRSLIISDTRIDQAFDQWFFMFGTPVPIVGQMYPMNITHVVCGEASGVDACGKRWAARRGKELISMPARWDQHGKQAGKVRNAEMGTIADAALIFWDGISGGSANMAALMLAAGKPVRVVHVSHKA